MDCLLDMKEFRNDELNVKVILEDKAYRQLVEIVKKSGGLETGGILIGYYSVSCQNAFITEVTNAPFDSKSGKSWFSRGIMGLKQLLIQRWNINEEYYLGEWHLHPKSYAKPSYVDVIQMKQIAIDIQYNCKEPILMIAGEHGGIIEIYIMLIINGKKYDFKEIKSKYF